MEKDTRFEGLKAEILRRAKEAQACVPEYSRAYKVETLQELMEVVKENFYWCCAHGVITPELVAEHEEEFEWNGIYANKSVKSGYILASGTATVEAWDNATVRAWGNAYVSSFFKIKVRLDEDAIYRLQSERIVYCNSNKISFQKHRDESYDGRAD